MFRTKLRILPAAGALTTAIVVTTLHTSPVMAHDNASSRTQVRVATTGLNLLSRPRSGAPVVTVRQMGSGSWICSPAGFGQRSRCYRG